MPCRRIRAHYEQSSEFQKGHIIGMKEAFWGANRRITRHMGRSDADIRKCWQEWLDIAPDSSLSTIRHVTCTRVSTMTIQRRLIERNLCSYRPLRHLPLPPSHCRAKLQWRLARSATNSNSNCVLTLIEDVSEDSEGSVPIQLSLLHASQALNQELWSGVPFLLTAGHLWSSLEARLQHNEDKTRLHVARIAMLKHFLGHPNLSSNVHVWDMMGRRLHLLGNVDDLT
ncbi:HTH_Tnp_Tc3_2 domain-containing protein [Trichonephila clavipes]|nr:HTH_Tnp_Tc3_2 domain-containing protein [Trichonephila clavipes]